MEEIEKLEINELAAALTPSNTESKEEGKNDDELKALVEDFHCSVADKTTIKKINVNKYFIIHQLLIVTKLLKGI